MDNLCIRFILCHCHNITAACLLYKLQQCCVQNMPAINLYFKREPNPFTINVKNTFVTFFLRCSGLRDDLNFLLEEDLSSINLCSLHCEMRNCEQLLGSLGLFAYQIGSLDLLNKALSDYGPENTRGFPRVTIKERKGQQTMIDKRNIHVASFSGM